MIIPSDRRLAAGTLVRYVAIAAALAGALVALHYHRLGLTLTHYDSRGHLVVARRIIDSLTPGWQQIGAVWLPLPHLLNMLPVQVDLFYRTGASAVAISIASFAIAAASVAWIVLTLTGCASAALAAAAVFGFNPNVLYLQATPMTEPLLLALTTLSVALLMAFVRDGGHGATRTGWALALACLTRYEAWPATAAALVIAAFALWRRGELLPNAVRAVARVAIHPVLAIAGFMLFSRIVVGSWFVSSGFFVPENKALGHPIVAAAEIWWGTHLLSGYLVIATAAAGLILLAVRGLASRRQGWQLVPLALIAMAALPWAAFVKGHPFRIRYMVPLVAVEAVGAGVATTLAGRWRAVAAVALMLVVGYELRPLDLRAPMVVEAQWDRPNMAVRDRVTEYLRRSYDGTKIMASMGSLGHYMQQASAGGFAIRDFLHEGNGDLWLVALDGPRRFVGWVLIEEKANGGDMLAKRARQDPHFLDGFTPVCEAAGMVLYRRTAKGQITKGQGAEGKGQNAGGS